MSARLYDGVKVEMSLGDLSMIHTAASCWEIANEKCEKLEKWNADLKIEGERQAKEISQQRERLIETEQDLKKWTEAAQTEKPYADANAFLDEHNTPFESKDVDAACKVIRALMAAAIKESAKPHVSPLLRQRIENAKDVLRQITPVVADCDGSFGEVAGDRFNAVYNTLQELYDELRVEVQ